MSATPSTGFCTTCREVHDLDGDCPERERHRKGQVALDACHALDKEPDKLEADVRALVAAARGLLRRHGRREEGIGMTQGGRTVPCPCETCEAARAALTAWPGVPA